MLYCSGLRCSGTINEHRWILCWTQTWLSVTDLTPLSCDAVSTCAANEKIWISHEAFAASCVDMQNFPTPLTRDCSMFITPLAKDVIAIMWCWPSDVIIQHVSFQRDFFLHCSCAGIKNQLPVFHHEVEIKDMTVKSDTKQRKVSYSKLHICFDGIYGQNTQGLPVTDSHIRSLSSFYSAFKVTYEVNEDTWRFHVSP